MGIPRAVSGFLLLALASCGGVTDGFIDDTSPERVTVSSQPSSVPGVPGPPVPFDVPEGVSAELVRTFDGDSFMARVAGEEVEVRMIGVNAPEGSECAGDLAKDAARELLESGPLTLVTDPNTDEFDRFGRALRFVYAGDLFVNFELVRTGLAVSLQSGHSLEPEFENLEERAFQSGFGMFGIEVCGTSSSTGRIVIDAVEWDPPGRDADNPNGEFVVLANTGDGRIDLSGWEIRDESSQHRFTFPRGAGLDEGDRLVVRSGCGTDVFDEYFFCADDPVWSNGGDTVYLLDDVGTVRDRLSYAGDF